MKRLLAIFTLSICSGCADVEDVGPYLDRISPGMSYQEVRQVIPQEIRRPKERCTHLYSGVYLTDTNALVSSQIVIWEEKDFGYSTGTIYFDAHDKVVGVDYNASSAYWGPKWGTSITVLCADPMRNIHKKAEQAPRPVPSKAAADGGL